MSMSIHKAETLGPYSARLSDVFRKRKKSVLDEAARDTPMRHTKERK